MTPTSPDTEKAAADMKNSDVKYFASTKHNKLPDKKEVREALRSSLLSDKKFMKKVKEEDKEKKKKNFKDFVSDVEKAKKKLGYEVINKPPYSVHRHTTHF
tara:strand:- start:52 stop:354 length:303 start_codon:yes stop_codon:yes gene_type:complete